MISKIANILLVLAALLTFVPKIISTWFPSIQFFTVFPWWILATAFGGLGLVLYTYILFTSKRSKIQIVNSLLLLATIIVFLIGQLLYEFNPSWQKYCFIVGVILFIIWLLIPNKRKED